MNLPANSKVVQFDVLESPGTSGSGKQHHCPIRAMVKDSNDACFKVVCDLFLPHVVIYLFLGLYMFLS
jgi:hypothetical protein